MDLRWVYLLCAATLALGLASVAVWGREARA
jgi:hypothetical protein